LLLIFEGYLLKKIVLGLLSLTSIVIICLFVFRASILALIVEHRGDSIFVNQDDIAYDQGPLVGGKFPAIKANYRGAVIYDVGQFVGDKGMIFIANRSVDWCPTCMGQLVQLQKALPNFQQAGINIVAMTYDSPHLQQPFIERFDITYPMLSDHKAFTVKTLGILNKNYQPGDIAYGIPNPGVFILDRDKTIVGKFFIADYGKRIDAGSLLQHAKALLRK
jgi:peroxiredoxin